MPTTRFSLETVLAQRVGALWEMAGKDATVDALTPNPDFDDPLAVGAGAAGLALADPATVVDADLATLTAAQRATLLAAAELRAKRTILGNWSLVTKTGGGSAQNFSDLLNGLREEIKDLREALAEDPAGGGSDPVDPDAPTVGLSAGWILGPGRSGCLGEF